MNVIKTILFLICCMLAGQIDALKLPKFSGFGGLLKFKTTLPEKKIIFPPSNNYCDVLPLSKQDLLSLIDADKEKLMKLTEAAATCENKIKEDKEGFARALLRDLGYIPVGAAIITYLVSTGWKYVPLIPFLSAGYVNPVFRDLKYYYFGSRSPVSFWRDMDKQKLDLAKHIESIAITKKAISYFEAELEHLKSREEIKKS
jgi:hypothetical protein